MLLPLALLGTLAGAVFLAAVVAWKAWPTAREAVPESTATTSDPRLSYPTPYRNVRPEVRYVGDDACAGCHADVAKTYRDHPMAHSLAPVAAATGIERYDAKARNPFEIPGFRYRVERGDGRAWHQEVVTDPRGRSLAETRAEVHYAVGSGHSGRAYLTDRDGFLFTTPLTWYPPKGIWDLSPGYEKNNPHFDRPITPDCVYCHANRAEVVPDTLNRYRKPTFQGHAIGCERCHGPGELHVRRHADAKLAAGEDDTIVNPGKLEPALREAVCQQCHLQGRQRVWRRGRDTFDYRPGLPFHLFMSEFVEPKKEGDVLKFVGTVEQMYASRCFEKSAGKSQMGCISCHDPHAVPAREKKVAFYRQRCLNCHQEKGCSLPLAARREKEDNCVACHMPKTGSTVSHAAITDHRVPRVASPPRPKDEGARPELTVPVHFHRDLVGKADAAGVNRDLGIALVRIANSEPGDRARTLAEKALPLLESALRGYGDDLTAREAMGSALWFQSRLEESFAAYQQVLEQAPNRENTLFLAAKLALRLRKTDLARRWAGRAIEVNPWRWGYYLALAQAHGQAGDWAKAKDATLAALKLHPSDFGARQLLVLSHLRLGEVARAEQELNTMLLMNPPRPEALRAWFNQELRQAGR